LRITRLKLQNWRNFKRVEVRLSQRSFFVGPNASGKSNLLDALRFLRDIVAVGGGLQEAVGRRGGLSELRCLSAKSNPNVAIQIDLGDDANSIQWTYSVEFNAHGKARSPRLTSENVSQDGKSVLKRPDLDDRTDPERLSQTALEQVNFNK